MKSYILVHHATGKEIEVKAEEMTAYPDFYQLMISEKPVGRFNTEQFSVYIKPEEVKKESTVIFKASGDGIHKLAAHKMSEMIDERNGNWKTKISSFYFF